MQEQTMTNPWASDRLIYRPVETPDDDEFFQELHHDPFGFMNSTPALPTPQARPDAMRHQKAMMDGPLMSVVICLPPLPQDPVRTHTRIGIVHVDKTSRYPQHRTGEIGINIHANWQGQGYGTEAIRWGLDFSFRRIGLHRVEIQALGWNLRARRLYERIGFVLEGTAREVWWHEGRFWDDYLLGILDREWEEIKKREEGKEVGKAK